MKRILAILALLALPLAAQEQKKEAERPAPPRIQKLFVLKYADPTQLTRLLSAFNAQISPNQEMRALAVSAPADGMAAIEEAIQRLDVPAAAPRNLDLTVWFLLAGEEEGAAGPPVPKELDSVVAQLKGSFAFKTYRLLDVLSLRTRTGRGAQVSSAGGVVQLGGTPQAVDVRGGFHLD